MTGGFPEVNIAPSSLRSGSGPEPRRHRRDGGAMDLRQIRYFTRVAHLRSFSKAAEQLEVAQPALSRQVQALEEELVYSSCSGQPAELSQPTRGWYSSNAARRS